MMSKTKFLVILGLLMSIGALTASSGFAATIDVYDTNTTDEIQAAIDSANPDDTINFASGTYNNVNLSINKALTIVGNGATLNGLNTSTPVFALTVTGSDPTLYRDISISNFTLNGVTAISSTGGGTNFRFTDLVLVGYSNGSGNGISTRSVSGLTITNVDISNFRDAISVGGGNNTLISDSHFHDTGRNAMSFFQDSGNIVVRNNNLSNAQYGIFFGGGVKYIDVSNNNITGFTRIALALIKASDSAIIKDNFIDFNQMAIVIKAGDVSHGPPTVISNILIDGNSIKNNTLLGILIENLPESYVGISLNITDTNEFGGNGFGYRDSLNWSTSEWNTEINNTFDIVKNYYQETPGPEPPKNPNLSIVNSLSKQVVKNGDKLIYTITIKNSGDGASSTITVSSGLSTSYESSSVSYISTGSSYSNNRWVISSLGAGDTAVLVLELTTKQSGTKDIISTLNSVNVTKTTPTKKLTINKDIKVTNVNAVSSSAIRKGKTITLATTLKNSGKDASGKVIVKITLPKGLKLKSVNNKGTYNTKTKQWSISIPAGKSVKLVLVATGTTKGYKKIVFNVNGKKQSKTIRVV
jgi:uncharacterized repeat protein (TIGR01451 family)